MNTALTLIGIAAIAYVVAKAVIAIIKWNERMLGRLSKDWRSHG